jgi:dipeptidyl aminopeptidase/acylaminoacyl peptidase
MIADREFCLLAWEDPGVPVSELQRATASQVVRSERELDGVESVKSKANAEARARQDGLALGGAACRGRRLPGSRSQGARWRRLHGFGLVCTAIDPGTSQAVRGKVAIGAAAALTLFLAPAADAAFPGRDGLIAFAREVGSKRPQIYVVRPNGRGLRRLTHHRLGAYSPAWSPDGRRIVFSAIVRGEGFQVFVKRLGGGVRRITRGRDEYNYPTWSPDGRRIAAVRGRWTPNGDYHESLVVMRATGRRRQVVFAGAGLSIRHPAWSPDGGSIAFEHTGVSSTGADPNIYVIPAQGGAARLIAYDGGSQDDPDWSPDGRLIAYSWGVVLGSDDIRVVRPDDTGQALVTNDLLVPDGAPAWAPSGTRLAISRLGRIWTLAPDGSGLRQITRGPARGPRAISDSDPSWQPR